MADIEARREARRRKILENSEKRLKKISGVEEKSTKTELDGFRLNTSYDHDTEAVRLPSIGTDEISIFTQTEVHNLENNASSNSLEVETIFQNPRSIANDSISNCNVEVVEHKNYRTVFILLMPVVLSFVIVTCDFFQIDVKPFYLNKIFVPLIIYEIAEYCFGFSANNSNFLTSILLLTNIRNPVVVNFVQYFQSFLNIVQDVMIYFFSFTATYWLLQLILI